MEEDSLLERVTAAAEDAWTATPPLARSNRSIKRAEKTGGYASHRISPPFLINFGGCIWQKHHLLALSMGLEAPDEVNSRCGPSETRNAASC
jgi:hypothetical protein